MGWKAIEGGGLRLSQVLREAEVAQLEAESSIE